MKKKFTFLIAALTLLAMFAVPMGMKGQNTKTEGFETATASSTYNSTVTVNSNQSDCGIGWSFYYGTVSTQGPIAGSKSAQMRWYKSALSNYPTLTSTTPIEGLTNVAFKARVGHVDVKMDVKYSSDGTNWTALATAVTFADTYAADFSYDIPSGGKYIQFGVSSSSTAPNGTYYSLLIDNVVFTYSGEITTYTVTYHANVTGTADIEVEYNEGDDVTVAANTFTNPGYAFTEWNTEADGSGDSYSPEDVIEDIDDDLDLYAQWEESDENTATLTATNLELTGSYTTNTQKTIDDITYVFTDLMLNSNRIQAKASTGTIKNTTAYPGDIISVAITHDGTARATTINGSVDGEDWVQVATGSGSINADFSGKGYKYFQITRGANAAYWTKIEITYSNSSSSLDQSDLAISSPTGDLTFDLYNNTTAQVISYTTSSTGAITITPAESSYFSYVHDASAKTITVTPLAVTPSAQTVTINQEADDNYYGGTATFTVSVVNSDPNAPGTENNPYTVAQARAAIDAGTGITDVYATGIVSEIKQAWNSQYNNITFNFVDNEGDNNFLQAYRCGSGDADASDVAVGDIVVVYGNLTKYGSTYEFGQGCELVSLTHPAVEVEAPTFSPVAGTYAEAQTVTISCATETAAIYYTIDGTDPATSNTTQQYVNPITVSSTMTIKAVAVMGQYTSTMATATFHINSQANPYTVAEVILFDEYPTSQVYVHGIVSTAATSLSNGTLTYYISDDGTTDNQIEVYKGKDLDNESFTSVDDIQVGDIVTVYGSVQIYNSTFELGSGNYLVSFERPAVPSITFDTDVINFNAEEHLAYELSFFYENFEVETYQDFAVQFYDADNQAINKPDWIFRASVTGLNSEGYQVTFAMISANEGAARSTYFKVYAVVNDEPVYSNLVTINQAAYVAPPTPGNWVLTSIADLTENDVFVIVGTDADDDGTYALPNDGGTNAPVATVITIVDGTISGEPDANLQWNISGDATNGFTFYPNGDTENWLYCSTTQASGSNNNIKVGTGNRKLFVLDENGYLVTNDTLVTRYLSIYFNSGVAQDWRSYINTTNGALPISFYKKVEAPTVYTLTINGFGDDNTVKNGWNLIAAPVATTPGQVNNMLSNTYDLYRFNSTAIGGEWENYKNPAHQNEFVIVPGQGYLYANSGNAESGNVTLEFSGDLYDGDGEITMVNEGWNLVGNPYYNMTTNIGRDFCRMNSTNDGLIPATADDNVNAWEGIFVEAAEVEETVTFSPATSNKSRSNEALVINLSQKSLIDRTIVRFGEGSSMSKFQLFDDCTKLYIARDGNDYAIATMDENTEMFSLNFKAKTAGKYTLSIGENANLSYIHIFDRMTGEDIDMLVEDSYSFIASPADNEERFIVRLSYNAGYGVEEIFAIQNGSDIMVNGNGQLQVFDVTGRMVMNTMVNGHETINTLSEGVYVFRLFGESVKTQKIVVR